MSGRKSTEVGDMLLKSSEARKAGERNWANRIYAGSLELKGNQEKIERYYGQVQQDKFALSSDCIRQFPQECEELEKQRKKLRSKGHNNYTGNLEKIEADRKAIEKSLQEADEESESIQKSIVGKYDYCDTEYKRAKKVAAKYKSTAKQWDAMIKELDHAVKMSGLECIEFRNAAQQMEQLQEKMRKLEEKSRRIIELRKKAAEAKAYLKKSVDEIDAALAGKFMAAEYEELKKQVSRTERMADAEAVNALTSVSERIGMFRAELDKRYAAFLEEQQKTAAGIAQLKGLLEADGYYEPTDYLRNGEQAKKHLLLSYIEDYGNRETLIREIEDGIREAEEAYEREEFAKAQNLTETADEKIHQAMEYAVLLQENMLKSAYMAVDIRKVMADFHYKVSAKMIDGNPKNGWRVTASQGGETIDFDRVYFNEEGTPEIGIDHKLAPGASCKTEWKEFMGALDKKGICIWNIDLEDGTPLIHRVKEEGTNIMNPPEPMPENGLVNERG